MIGDQMTRRVVAGLVMACGAASAAGQTTYYVRTSGSDSNSGTSAGSAWETLEHAVDEVSAGDTIYVGAGTYTDQVELSGDGTSGSPIIVIADTTGAFTGDAGAVTLQRNGTVLEADKDDYWTFRGFVFESTNPGKDSVKIEDSDGIVFESCEFRGGDAALVLEKSSVTITGGLFTGMKKEAIESEKSTLTITGVTFENSTNDDRTVEVKDGGTLTMDRCRILDGEYGVYVEKGDATITNTLIANISGDMKDGIYLKDDADATIVNCTIWGVNDDGLEAKESDAYVRNTIFSDIGDDCMKDSSSDIDANTNLMYQYGGSRSDGFNSPNEYSFDPAFANEGSGDFSLSASSGAIDIGLDMSSYTSVDINGTTRPMGAGWDLGAYEGGGSITYASVPYITDFESGAGDEWSDRTTTTLAALTEYLGRYSEQDGSTLYVDSMVGGETYYLFFDLFVIDNWEGSGSSSDDLIVTVDGSEVFRETFDNSTGSQTYPGTPDENGSNIGYGSHVDSTYRRIYLSFTADDDKAAIRIESDMTADITNESWGLDNVMVLSEEDAYPYLPIFTDVSSGTGFGVSNSSGVQRASGLHWGDLDDDGDMDAIVTGEASVVCVFDAAFGTFTATTIGSGQLWRQGALLDADLDGDLDFWAGCDGSYYVEGLYENNYPASFSWRGASGVSDPYNNEGVAAGDFDADGRTDIVMLSANGNWVLTNEGTSPGTFSATNDSADGLHVAGAYGNGAFISSADVNADGYLDFFYHYSGGKLFLSNGDGTWSVAGSAPVADTANDQKTGSAWGDYDNDGDLDLYIPYRSGGGRLYQNSGGSFTNVASVAGITDSAAQSSASWGDYDNDGDLDLLIATAAGDDMLLYDNQGDGTFRWVDKGAAIPGDVHDAVFVDYDSDGDLDIGATVAGGNNVLLRNDTDDDAYLKVRLLWENGGVQTPVVGVRVELWDSGASTLLAVRQVGGARGLGGGEPVWAHFGGVDPGTEYVVTVYWPGKDPESVSVTPSGVSTTFGAVTVPQMLTITGRSDSVRVIRWREVGAVSDP